MAEQRIFASFIFCLFIFGSAPGMTFLVIGKIHCRNSETTDNPDLPEWLFTQGIIQLLLFAYLIWWSVCLYNTRGDPYPGDSYFRTYNICMISVSLALELTWCLVGIIRVIRDQYCDEIINNTCIAAITIGFVGIFIISAKVSS